MDIRREWRRAKPAFGSKFTLGDLVADFKHRRKDPDSPIMRNRDTVVDLCQQATDITDAINKACASIRPNGKMHNHQSKVPAVTKIQFADRLNRRRRSFLHCKSFSSLLIRVQRVGAATHQVGPVYSWDVAVRVGAYLGLEPEVVEVHAGTAQGAKALKLPQEDGHLIMDLLPRELLALTADEVEDFLCVYRNVLSKCSVLKKPKRRTRSDVQA